MHARVDVCTSSTVSGPRRPPRVQGDGATGRRYGATVLRYGATVQRAWSLTLGVVRLGVRLLIHCLGRLEVHGRVFTNDHEGLLGIHGLHCLDGSVSAWDGVYTGWPGGWVKGGWIGPSLERLASLLPCLPGLTASHPHPAPSVRAAFTYGPRAREHKHNVQQSSKCVGPPTCTGLARLTAENYKNKLKRTNWEERSTTATVGNRGGRGGRP